MWVLILASFLIVGVPVINDRLNLLSDATKMVALNLSTLFYRAGDTMAHIGRASSMNKDELYSTMREYSLELIQALNAQRAYTQRQKKMMNLDGNGKSECGF